MKYQAAVITVSDKGSVGERVDTSGPAICAMLEKAGFTVTYTAIVPDEIPQIQTELTTAADGRHINLIITTGGTGLSQRDVTPEATLAVLDREIRAIPVAMWVEGLKITPPRHAFPSRSRHPWPQPHSQSPRLRKSRPGKPFRCHRRTGTRHAYDRRGRPLTPCNTKTPVPHWDTGAFLSLLLTPLPSWRIRFRRSLQFPFPGPRSAEKPPPGQCTPPQRPAAARRWPTRRPSAQ